MKNFDNSMLSTYSQCQWKYALRYEWHRESLETRVSTEVGTSTHAFFDNLLSGNPPQDAIISECDRLAAINGYDESEQAQMLFLSAANELITHYPVLRTENNQVLILNPSTRAPRWLVKYYQPEIPFILPLSADYNFMGKMDCVVEDGNGHLFILELKTSSRANNILWRDKWKMDTQPRGYTWAINQHTERPIVGVIIIPIAVLSKRCEATPEIELIYTPQELDQWHRDTLALCAEVEHSSFLPTGRYAGNCISSALGRCDYFYFCQSGYKEELLIQLTQEHEWSPLATRESNHVTIAYGDNPESQISTK